MNVNLNRNFAFHKCQGREDTSQLLSRRKFDETKIISYDAVESTVRAKSNKKQHNATHSNIISKKVQCCGHRSVSQHKHWTNLFKMP